MGFVLTNLLRGYDANIRGFLNRKRSFRIRPQREDFTALAGERGQWRDKLRRGWVQPVVIRNPEKYLHSSRSR